MPAVPAGADFIPYFYYYFMLFQNIMPNEDNIPLVFFYNYDLKIH